MLYEDLKFELAQHVTGEQRRSIDATLRGSFDEIRDATEWLRDSVGALEQEVHAVLFGGSPRDNTSAGSF